ncbi:helix-turn-helix domain-containing protein [Rhizobium sp. BK456]|uniref:helix-turn-helix domain-containing protein n=1 Tax=Rhizobium sp. BK456 TaxID=2587007 RepID=UPI0016221E76|nr:helix-turn-helix domain-containing protein [Rhizobium sp. BK456]MBB3521086.1 putative transcriptional regulator [Rhizobium sp. BK456]
MTLEDYIHEHTTVTAFAALLGKSRAQVHRYMRGENLSKSVIEEICRATSGAVEPKSFFQSASAE